MAETNINEQRKFESFSAEDLQAIYKGIHVVEMHISDCSKKDDKLTYFTHWCVGITYDKENKQSTYKNTTYWNIFDLKSDKISREVERFFKSTKNTQGDIGGGKPEKPPIYVYCFYDPTKSN